MAGEALKGHLELLLLSVVDSGVAHGYAIVEELRRASDGTFDLPDGTVYPALHRLTAAGLLKAKWDETGPRRRRVYELTAKGRRELVRRRGDWVRFERGVRGVLALAER